MTDNLISKDLEKGKWTLNLCFGRETHVLNNLTAAQAQHNIRLIVFGNRDCVSFNCFQQ